jgi:type II secretory pathway component GspD/PulD (secretin)
MRTLLPGILCLIMVVGLVVTAPAARAQDDADERTPNGRRVTSGETTRLAFREVEVGDLIPFIIETTGKVVISRADVNNREITIVSDSPIPQSKALDLVFYALQQEGIAVSETKDYITLRDQAEVDQLDVAVVGPEQSLLGREDIGIMVRKVFALQNVTAEDVADVLSEDFPDFVQVSFNEQSNTVAVLGSIALLQRAEELLLAIDRPSAGSVRTRTFKLRFADAETIAENIRELYEGDDASAQAQQQQFNRFRRFGRGGGDEGESGGSPSANLRVTANIQQNSVTVVAEPGVLEAVEMLIDREWDIPVETENVIPRVYTLEHTDPVKVDRKSVV